jgi:uncharacterized Zn-finger protein
VVHEKLRPFECSICPAKFGKKFHLKTHVKGVHEKLRPFECSICKAKFGTNSNLNSHIKQVHKIV